VLARSVRPDVVVVDVGPGRPSTWRLVQRLVAELPDSAVLVLAGRRSTGLLRRALDSGARGFATDAQAPAELADFIRRAAAGEHVIDPGVAAAAVGPPSGSPLTEREGQILRLAAEGLPTREMARRLFLAEGTVRNHLSVILRKTGSRNRLQAVQRADGAGWL
jgi:two-component system response regulator DesR